MKNLSKKSKRTISGCISDFGFTKREGKVLKLPLTSPLGHHYKACVWDEQQNFALLWNPHHQAISCRI